MTIINFRKTRRNIWTMPRQRRIGKRLRTFSGIFSIVVLAAIFQLHQSGVLRSAVDNVAPGLGVKSNLTKITRPSRAKTIQGRATVIDGDTIRIKGQKIRLHGIDAPEARQTCIGNSGIRVRCGAMATRYLKRYLRAKASVTCKFIDRDRYGRFVGDCYRRDGQSIAIAMVSTGHALDWPRYSKGAYAHQQNRAKRNKRGIWATRFEMPWNFRRKRNSG